MTGYGSIEQAVEVTKAGAFDYLTKPVIDDEIRLVVEKALRQQALLHENKRLRSQLDQHFGLANVVGRDSRMRKVFDLVEAVADSKTTVLIRGESGTGKSLLARALHRLSPRRDKPFVEISCGALPEHLLESRSCSATSRGRSPARRETSPDGSRRPRAGRSSSTRSTPPRRRCR